MPNRKFKTKFGIFEKIGHHRGFLFATAFGEESKGIGP